MPAGRKLHTAPMPLLGGIAIAASALFAFLLLVSILPITLLATSVIGAVSACTIIIIVGLVDDRRHLPAWLKFSGQLIAALILVYVGVQVRLSVPNWLNIAITILWLVGITNAMNFMDNMDGLSAGVSGVAAAFILLLAAFNNQHLVAALAAGILGACLGFLRYNFKPARIFMGDAGFHVFGVLIGFAMHPIAVSR